MKKSAFLLLFTVLYLPLSANRDHPRKAPAPAPFDVRQSLHTSSDALLDVIKPGFNPIPLAILNRTKCVILINSKGAQTASGLASCRLTANRWSGPVIVTFQSADRVEASRNRELLVLMVNTRATQSVVRGQWNLGAKLGTMPGPLIATAPGFRDSDIKAEAYTYNRTGSQKLAPVQLTGSVKVDSPTTVDLYGKVVKVPSILKGRTKPPNIANDYVKMVDSFFNMITPVGIIIHHSAVLPTTNRAPENVKQVDEFHRERGFAVVCNGQLFHIAYQYLILPNGKIKAGRPENCQGAHAYGYNAYLGIALAGDFSSADNPKGGKGLTQPTAEQMRSLEELCRKIMERYHIAATNVLRHSDVSRTHCPGNRFSFQEFRRRLIAPP